MGRRVPEFEDEFQPADCILQWAWAPRALRESRFLGSAGQTPRDIALMLGVLPTAGACLKIPSCGLCALPVRRRQFSGGVRVIRVPQPRSPCRNVETWRGRRVRYCLCAV